jgi:hypothetical protein
VDGDSLRHRAKCAHASHRTPHFGRAVEPHGDGLSTRLSIELKDPLSLGSPWMSRRWSTRVVSATLMALEGFLSLRAVGKEARSTAYSGFPNFGPSYNSSSSSFSSDPSRSSNSSNSIELASFKGGKVGYGNGGETLWPSIAYMVGRRRGIVAEEGGEDSCVRQESVANIFYSRRRHGKQGKRDAKKKWHALTPPHEEGVAVTCSEHETATRPITCLCLGNHYRHQ